MANFQYHCASLGREASIEINHQRDDNLTDFGRATLEDRYLLPGETPQTLFGRVACYFAQDEDHAQRLYDYISNLWFMPATPILSNGGTARGMPISCFLNQVGDSLKDIADTWNENIWLASRGGGIGTHWGGVRSIGEQVGMNGKSSGVVPFMKVMDSMTLAISQGSLRRGSAAVYLDVEHPEIIEFINIRKPEGDVNRQCLNVHNGVVISDKFMEAVKAGEDYDLISPKTGEAVGKANAREVWQRLLEARVQTGEPYILFKDTVNAQRPDVYQHHGLNVKQSNLCSEIMLHTGPDQHNHERTAVCCLSSLNAATAREWYGNEQFIADVMRFLDNVMTDFIDRASDEPGFKNAVYSATRERSIGLGMMGWHSYLQQNNIAFETPMAKSLNLRMWKWLRTAADDANRTMAEELGPCPDAEEAGMMKRFSHVFAIAPTASISIICGGTSAGIEPLPANAYNHKTLSGSFMVKNPELDKVLRKYAKERGVNGRWTSAQWRSIVAHEGSVQHLDYLTDDEKFLYRTFREIDQRWVIEHAGDRQPYICQGQSVNISLPGDVHKAELHALHWRAWEHNLKALYYVRSTSVRRADSVAGEMPTEDVRSSTGLAPQSAVSQIDECLACQ